MKTIVYYYSNKGSNKYLAERIAKDLSVEIEEIKPRLNAHLLMLMGVNFGNRRLRTNLEDYDRIILCGPIWMGKLIVPLRNFVKKYQSGIKKMVFVSCCGSTFEKKDDKFGHNHVFKSVQGILNDKCVYCQAFPITLVLPEEQKDDSDAFMKTHLNDDNFKDEILSVYQNFIKKIEEKDTWK